MILVYELNETSVQAQVMGHEVNDNIQNTGWGKQVVWVVSETMN